ncbi:unnamed protein product [Clonostachys chloroleuca]|uniref:Uncharacterized protein n=1 Tax=Clonostachys chloroleuca TaxID=1926264 RepID=A0AA35Q8T7_9HYPO|nr:unnamed protein product [Clonostachys chloroleuca]
MDYCLKQWASTPSGTSIQYAYSLYSAGWTWVDGLAWSKGDASAQPVERSDKWRRFTWHWWIHFCGSRLRAWTILTMAEMVGRFADSHGRGGVEDETTAAVFCVGGHRYELQRARIPDDNINIWPTGQYDLNPSPVVDDQQLVSDYMEWWRSGELQYGYQMVVGRQEKLVRTSGEAVPRSEWALHVNRTHTATAMTRSRTLSSDLDPRSQ